jgi:glycerophosphoryl diester phosphodiesterase
MVQVIAHRGFSGRFPENTAIAFREALSLGVEAVELDVHLSRDGEPIVIHDAAVDRTSDGSGRVDQLNLSDIRSLDAGGWFASAFRGERFLTLQDALELLGGQARLNVHVKAYDHDREEVIPLTARLLEDRGLLGSAYIASDEESIRLAARIVPQLATCNLTTQPKETYIVRSASVGCRILQPGNAQVDEALVSEAHRCGMEVNPFYADDEAEMRRLTASGVDGILTNWPDRLLTLREGGNFP